MKGKNLVIFGLGATSGFIGGSVFVLSKILESERLRQASVDALADKIEKVLFGEVHRRPRSDSRVSYRRYYQDSKYADYSLYCLADKCIFKTRKDAEKVLNEMNDLAMTYGVVSVLDYYDLCPCETHCSHVTDNYYGWSQRDIADMAIISCHNGYTIDLPKATRLN